MQNLPSRQGKNCGSPSHADAGHLRSSDKSGQNVAVLLQIGPVGDFVQNPGKFPEHPAGRGWIGLQKVSF